MFTASFTRKHSIEGSKLARAPAFSNASAEQRSICAVQIGPALVSEADSSIAIHIDNSSFPNWNSTDQKRFVSIAGTS
jgi:hypothetical protein